MRHRHESPLKGFVEERERENKRKLLSVGLQFKLSERLRNGIQYRVSIRAKDRTRVQSETLRRAANVTRGIVTGVTKGNSPRRT